jgi:hypothetical protein
VRLLPAAGVRLVGPLALHGVVTTSDRLDTTQCEPLGKPRS